MQRALHEYSKSIDTTTGYGYSEKLVAIPASVQRTGDPQKGLNYLIYGNYVKSGIPYGIYSTFLGNVKTNYLQRTGDAALLAHNVNVVEGKNGVKMVTPNCLQCHAQEFEGRLIVGQGNSFADYTVNQKMNGKMADFLIKFLKGKNNDAYLASKNFTTTLKTVAPNIVTEVVGVNIAERLTYLLLAHRDPVKFEWVDSAQYEIPEAVIPSDVPAWWLLKKKNAMFYNGFGRGDFGKFIMASNVLTTENLDEAKKVNDSIGNVVAFLMQLQAPKYTRMIDENASAQGKILFEANCSKCHGSYGDNGVYPNLLIPEHIIKTDSLLFVRNFKHPHMVNWFNNSWFANGDDHPARLVLFGGYIAPPLDGVWCTAPYLHNGSVPTLHAMLNSSERPTYWKRDFKKPVYDYINIGWEYEKLEKPGGTTVYNTTLPGYGNFGHTFGDKLTERERMALIEYLKTL